MQSVLFDLDGTLVDTESLAMDVTREWLSSRGLASSSSLERLIVGRTWTLASGLLKDALKLPMPVDAIERELVEAYRRQTAQGVPAVPGADRFVRSIAGQFRLFVVSGSPRRDIEHALRCLGVREHFEGYLGAEDYPRSKPAPDSYLAALERYGLSSQEALVFEDSEAGIAAAEAAGLPLIVVTAAQTHPPANAAGKRAIRDFTGLDAAWLSKAFQRP